MSTVKYYIPYLSVLGKKKRIQSLEFFAKIVHGFRRLTILVKSCILDAGLGSEYATADSNPLLIFSKNEADLCSN